MNVIVVGVDNSDGAKAALAFAQPMTFASSMPDTPMPTSSVTP